MESGPIKGTARTPDGLTEKDRAENVMITDLVRNDLQTVCRPGTVEVTSLLAVEEHPGLVHLVSRVRGTLSDDVVRSGELWRRLLAGTFPPGSVSGAPKSSALRIIRELEPAPRGPYCGAVGWVEPTAGPPSPSASARSGGPTACSGSAPAPASPGAPTRRRSGTRPSSRRSGWSRWRRPDGRGGAGGRRPGVGVPGYRGGVAHVPGSGVPEALAPYVSAVVPYDLDMGAPGVHRGMPGAG